MFLSPSKIRKEIIRFGKNLFCKLVFCVDVTFVFKLYSIWSIVAQESNLGRNGRILRKKSCFPKASYRTMSDLTRTRSNPYFGAPETPVGQCLAPLDNVQLRVSDRRSFLFWSYFTNQVSN
jgi:hypothetical protein